MSPSTASQSQRGRQREADVVKLLMKDPEAYAVRCASGPVDVVEVRKVWLSDPAPADCSVRFIQVKTTKRPYERFGPKERATLLEAARRAGADAWLAHWPSGGTLRWIPSRDWPS
jgi:hypothetical protein